MENRPIINLAWHDALTVFRIPKESPYLDSGWTEYLYIDMIVGFQRPPASTGRVKTNALFNALLACCENDAIPHDKVVDNNQVFYAISALVFLEWLKANGEKPSKHIQAWFDAVGVCSKKTTALDETINKPESNPKPKNLVDLDIEVLINLIKAMGLDPLNLPKQEKKGVLTSKAQIRGEVPKECGIYNEGRFDRAWTRATTVLKEIRFA